MIFLDVAILSMNKRMGNYILKNLISKLDKKTKNNIQFISAEEFANCRNKLRGRKRKHSGIETTSQKQVG